jgi:hypothetical protein
VGASLMRRLGAGVRALVVTLSCVNKIRLEEVTE